MPPTKENHVLRHALAEEFGWKCHYCRIGLTCHICDPEGVKLGMAMATLDHVLAKSKGGTRHWHNVVLACEPCNTRKGDGPVEKLQRETKRRPVSPLTQRINGDVAICREKGNTKIAFPLKVLADAMCVALYQHYGKELTSYLCTECDRWHIQRQSPITTIWIEEEA